jgi:hypothetical protein
MLGAGGLPVRLALAGGLGAVVNCALDEEPVLLPRLRGHRLELGFLGNLTTCLVVAQIVGHDFTQGFLAALAGTAILRTLKRRIEKACEDELARLEEER